MGGVRLMFIWHGASAGGAPPHLPRAYSAALHGLRSRALPVETPEERILRRLRMTRTCSRHALIQGSLTCPPWNVYVILRRNDEGSAPPTSPQGAFPSCRHS